MAEENTQSVESTVREIRRKTRKKYSAEEKLRIVLEGLRGEEAIAELCRQESIHQNMYYKWCKDFREWLNWWVNKVSNLERIFWETLLSQLALIEVIDKQTNSTMKGIRATRETS